MPHNAWAPARKTHSGGRLKVAEAVAVPVTPPLPSADINAAGFASVNVTTPGPRNLLHVTVTGGVVGRCIPVLPIRGILASSETETASVSGLATVAERTVLMGRGP